MHRAAWSTQITNSPKPLVVFALLTAPFLCGCGGESTGIVVSGNVVFRGQPLDEGSIEFSPAEGQATLSGAPIKDGYYVLPTKNGLAPGKYHVRISSTEGGDPPADALPGEVAVVVKERIPKEYNSATTLTANVEDASENKFDFEIP